MVDSPTMSEETDDTTPQRFTVLYVDAGTVKLQTGVYTSTFPLVFGIKPETAIEGLSYCPLAIKNGTKPVENSL